MISPLSPPVFFTNLTLSICIVLSTALHISYIANAAIEIKRSSKDIGSSLDADIQIYLGEEYLKLTQDINLSEYFITSRAEVKPIVEDDKLFKLNDVENIKVLVKKAEGQKCPRCWKILETSCERNNCGLKN